MSGRFWRCGFVPFDRKSGHSRVQQRFISCTTYWLHSVFSRESEARLVPKQTWYALGGHLAEILHEWFSTPEPTDKLLRLWNQLVQVQGDMVKEAEPLPGFFMLTPTPVAMAELVDGPADY